MAAGRVDPISAINPTKIDWIIKVRVVRIWLMPASPSTSSYHGIEMVLCDSEKVVYRHILKECPEFFQISPTVSV
ncbi:replication protein A 70 kDa DNA-binding subunit A-like [Senna tora]|uniref:Replication protein A 70 kDa DNA-binding subunit A-like n=1 Tax=Senna tora TaxID=362788 RepID=A0A834WH87_9FABA|nr:replication protein A 70 kDa DNA-binding subunit A-like [Senna tora]